MAPHLDKATIYNSDIDDIQNYITGISGTIQSNQHALKACEHLIERLDRNHKRKETEHIPPYEIGLYEYLAEYRNNLKNDFETQAENLLKCVALCGYATNNPITTAQAQE